MVALPHRNDEPPNSTPSDPLALFPTTPKIPGNDLFALIADFFDWLEMDWQLPLSAPEKAREPLPYPIDLGPGPYTVPDLVMLYGRSVHSVHQFLWKHRIPTAGSRPSGKGGCYTLYWKQDLLPVIEHWEWERLMSAIDTWWMRFFAPACGTCRRCSIHAHQAAITQQIHCSRSVPLAHLRVVFRQLLEEVRHLRSIEAWWQTHANDNWQGALCGNWGIILIYLLDRRLLALSYDELVSLKPLRDKGYQDLARLWRHRYPDEYERFQRALTMTKFHSWGQEQALAVFSLLILLNHGLTGLNGLERPLSASELQQICTEKRLVTIHVGLGIYLPYPLHADIRIGHVALDDVRYYFWQYAANQNQQSKKQRWDQGPRFWQSTTVSVIEQALAAPVYEGAKSILPRRPEIERKVINPYRIFSEGKKNNTSYLLLPPHVQKGVMTYVIYCHQEQHMAPTTLRTHMLTLMHFLTWARLQGKLPGYPHWNRQQTHEILYTYAANYSNIKASTRRERLLEIAHFFTTLANLEYPTPTGYHLLYKLEKGAGDAGSSRILPKEEIMDRVFHDGVCQLSYDPFSRLALTIQYYCGTRVTETCELHLFCILEDRDGHAYLLIPLGKTKQERPFPIVELGIGPLLEYMDEIISLRLTPEGTSRLLGRTNFRYLENDPEKAKDWHYLFDRISNGDGRDYRRGRLSRQRVSHAMQEALLITAKTNANDLFQLATYRPICQHRRRKGQKCSYFAVEAGRTSCPCCSSPLSGKVGARCQHLLEAEFVCDGVAHQGELFCPKCDHPLADFQPITTHIFRHNSVSRAHRAGVPLAQNMRLHGH
jgi:site-specific recombinase XerD